MKEILITEYGECADKTCPFNRECACHYTAGDFRCEDGFTPQIFLDDETNKFYCKTAIEEIDEEELYRTIPKNYWQLGQGFVKIT